MAASETLTRAMTGAGLVGAIVMAIIAGPWGHAGLLCLVFLLGWTEARAAFRLAWPDFGRWFHEGAGMLVVAVPTLGLLQLGWCGGAYAWSVPLGWFVLMWTNDTAAYIFGRSLGRHRIAPSISPGKTWEGWAGGTLSTLLVGYGVLGRWEGGAILGDAQWLMLAGVVAVLGPVGDLMESALKRKAGLKDSGNLLPGHGGILDRFDSHVIAAPVAAILLHVF